MTPIYFPFTFISEPVADAIKFCFRQCVVYQPARFTIYENLQNWCKEGAMEIRVPFEGDEERLAASLKDYRQWAKLHHDSQGLRTVFSGRPGETVPFFDETSPSRILADLKQHEQRNQHNGQADTNFGARLFLAIAQEHDLEKERLQQDLISIEAMENQLLANLQGRRQTGDLLPDKNSKRLFNPGDAAEYMIPDRFMAWFRFLQFDRDLDRDSPGLFLTSSPTALDHLLGRVPQSHEILSTDTIPLYNQTTAEITAWRNHFRQQLRRLPQTYPQKAAVTVAASPPDTTAKWSVSLNVYLVPRESSLSVFARCSGRAFPSTGDNTPKRSAPHTFVGSISVCPTVQKLS